MDPKLSGLDPTLADAYNRVMSGPTTPPTPAPQAGIPPQSQPQMPPAQPAPFVQQGAPMQTTPIPTVPAPTQPVQAQTPATPPLHDPAFGGTVAFNANNAGKNQGTTVLKHGGSKIMPIFVGLGIIVLLVVYTFVWIKVFNLKLPFLPF